MILEQKILLTCLVPLYAIFSYSGYRALLGFGHILKEHDDNLNNCEDTDKNSKPNQNSRKFSKRDCLLHEPVYLFRQIHRLFSSFFGKLFLRVRNLDKFVRLLVKLIRRFYCIFRDLFLSFRHFKKFSDLFCKSVNLLWQSNCSLKRGSEVLTHLSLLVLHRLKSAFCAAGFATAGRTEQATD